MLNDSVQTEEDIERYLGIPTLAVVPSRGLDSKNSKKSIRIKSERQSIHGA